MDGCATTGTLPSEDMDEAALCGCHHCYKDACFIAPLVLSLVGGWHKRVCSVLRKSHANALAAREPGKLFLPATKSRKVGNSPNIAKNAGKSNRMISVHFACFRKLNIIQFSLFKNSTFQVEFSHTDNF